MGNDCLDGHACLCQPTKAQIRGALKHGWRVLAMVGPTWCENLVLTIVACTTILSVQSGTLALGACRTRQCGLEYPFLPRNDGPFGRKIIQAADTFRKFSWSSHPVFQHFAEIIGHEKGLSTSDNFEHIVWSRFLAFESFHKSGQKVGMCKWFQVFLFLRSLFLTTGQACLWCSSGRIWMSHGCPQLFFTGTL